MEKKNNYIKPDKTGKTIYNSENISHRTQMKKAFSNSKMTNKINLNTSLNIFKIYVLINTYLLLCNRGYYDNNGNNKYNNSNITMKHAILLLSSYGINYMNNFLSQFNNDKRFDIYIHIDGQSKIDIENDKKITKSKIKYIKHLFKSEKYSSKMVDAMSELLIKANKTDNYDYFHYFSDSCYLIKTLDDFYQFFIRNNNKSYMTFYLDKNFLYKNQSFILYKGSQWMSLHNSIVHKLLDKFNLIHKYKEAIKNKTIKLLLGAPDEFIIQHIIVNDICKGKPQEFNLINNNLRFIRWKGCDKIYCPNYLP